MSRGEQNWQKAPAISQILARASWLVSRGDSGGILQLFDPQGQRRATLPEAIDEEGDESE